MQTQGPWSRPEIDDYLQAARFPMRLACHAADGFPRIVSLWYLWQDSTLLCVTHRNAALVGQLTRDARIGFEIATNDAPYYGVRGTATAQLMPLGDSDLLERLILRYLGDTDSALARWLLARRAEEMVISLAPRTLSSWDYRARMQR